MPFRKPPTEQTLFFKDTETKTNARIAEIEKLAGSGERLAGYKALNQSLHGFYNGGKPGVMNPDGTGAGVMIGGLAGMFAAMGLIASYAVVPVGITVTAGAIILSASAAGAGTGGFFGGWNQRKRLRSQYGSIKNARVMYGLETTMKEKIAKEADTIRAAKLQQQFSATFGKEASAAGIGGIFRDVAANAGENIREIDGLDNPAARLARYSALKYILQGFYSDGKPKITDRKKLRADYGRPGNARALYKLEKTLEKKTGKEAEAIRFLDRAAALQQQFGDASDQKASAFAAVTAPAVVIKPAQLRS